jgi:hypothetical protein
MSSAPARPTLIALHSAGRRRIFSFMSGEGSGGGARRPAPRPIQLATDYFGITLTLTALAIGGIVVGLGGVPVASTLLRFALGIGAGAGGLFSAAGHIAVGDDTARDMGWPVGTPWQKEVGMAGLALGVASIVAAFSRSPTAWTVATIAVSLFLVGDAAVHVPDVRRGGEEATLAAKSVPGDLFLPATLIVLRILA